MPERGLLTVLLRRADLSTRLTDSEIANLGKHFRRRTAWLGPYADPREYAVEMGLRVVRQPLAGNDEGAVVVGDVLLYRGDNDPRIWGVRVYMGLVQSLLRGVAGHTLTDRLRAVGELAMGPLIAGEATLEDVLRDQIYCPVWLMKAKVDMLREARRWPTMAVA